jgi:hypothetical protein
MAEIKIEKKKTTWPWVLLGLVVIALLAYFLLFQDKNSNVDPINDNDSITAVQNTDNNFRCAYFI